MTVAFISCQQTGLTEEEIRSIVREEVSALAPVTIPDYALGVALRNALNKPGGPIYKSDLESLTSLDLEDNNISDISPLTGLTNLEELGLDGNEISDISPLSGLTNLEMLGLDGNEISDISPLSGLTNLEELWLDRNPLSPEAIYLHIPQLEIKGVFVYR